MNKKILAKEESLKRYRDRIKQYKQKWTFQNNENKPTNKSVENVRGQTNNGMQRKQNNFEVKYKNWKNKTEKSNG